MLEELSLEGNPIRDKGAAALVMSLMAATHVRFLCLQHTQAGILTVQAVHHVLQSAPARPTSAPLALEELYLTGNQLPAAAVSDMLGVLTLGQLPIRAGAAPIRLKSMTLPSDLEDALHARLANLSCKVLFTRS